MLVATGATGATGPTGPTGAGAIIPFASGLPVNMTSIVGGLAGLPAFVGFGTGFSGVQILSSTINLVGETSSLAFSVPRDGTITAISATASVAAALSIGLTDIEITAQLYQSTAPDNSFAAVPGAIVTLAPTLSGIISIGDFASGITTGLSIPVTAETRLLLVFSITADGLTVVNTLEAFLGGGVAIE